MSAADLGPEDTADGFLIAERAAVVGQDVVNRCALSLHTLRILRRAL